MDIDLFSGDEKPEVKKPELKKEISRSPAELTARLAELYPAVNTRSTPIPTRWADNEDCCK